MGAVMVGSMYESGDRCCMASSYIVGNVVVKETVSLVNAHTPWYLDDQRWGGSDGPDQIGSMYALSRQPRTDSLCHELTRRPISFP